METTCHCGSNGLSLLPWPCPGHINPSDRIARTCPSFWVSIYTTWQSLWPSVTQGSKKGKKRFFLYGRSSGSKWMLRLTCFVLVNFYCFASKRRNHVIVHVVQLDFQSQKITIKANHLKVWKGSDKKGTLTWKILGCWPLSLTPTPNMFPQAIP